MKRRLNGVVEVFLGLSALETWRQLRSRREKAKRRTFMAAFGWIVGVIGAVLFVYLLVATVDSSSFMERHWRWQWL